MQSRGNADREVWPHIRHVRDRLLDLHFSHSGGAKRDAIGKERPDIRERCQQVR